MMNRSKKNGSKIKGEKLVNGKTVKPPKKGEPFGAWVEIQRRPTEIVHFLEFRGSAVGVWFYDEVDRIRILADGTREVQYTVEHAPGKIDVRDITTEDSVRALIQTGATVARALSSVFRAQQAEAAAKPRARKIKHVLGAAP